MRNKRERGRGTKGTKKGKQEGEGTIKKRKKGGNKREIGRGTKEAKAEEQEGET